MAKANFTFPDGTKMVFDGTPEEVSKFMDAYKTTKESKTKESKTKESKTKESKTDGPTGRIRQLINDGFFVEKRNINDILEKLEERGFIYKQTGISSQLTKLTKNREIRRIKEDGKWYYVNP